MTVKDVRDVLGARVQKRLNINNHISIAANERCTGIFQRPLRTSDRSVQSAGYPDSGDVRYCLYHFC